MVKERVSGKTGCISVSESTKIYLKKKSIEYLTSGDIWKHSYQEREVAKGATSVTVCAGFVPTTCFL